MMQMIQVTIPDAFVVIEKIKYEELLSKELEGQYYTLDDLARLTNKSKSWLHANMLNNHQIMKRMERFTFSPSKKGEKWMFKANELRKFLDAEFHNILRRN